jgi:hypothetical protein
MPIASMALVVAISRFGGVEMLGEYSFLLTFFFIGQTCATAGLHIIVTRDVARDRRRRRRLLRERLLDRRARSHRAVADPPAALHVERPVTATRIGLC